MYKLKSGIAYITAAAVIVVLLLAVYGGGALGILDFKPGIRQRDCAGV